ncbi:phage late control D family protein [Photobacterium damselae]|uniref:phage late control D family protein n=1 Tax=Photobacterium damselae TaxID=38293 RepID=UPI00406884A6
MATLIRPTIVLNWAGRNVTLDIGPFVKSITYTSSLNKSKKNTPDSISLVLNNLDKRFLNEWMPTKGDSLNPGILYRDKQWMWGRFEIDDIKYRFAPDEVIIGASAATINRTALDKLQSRAWDNIQLSTLLQLIARESGMNGILTGNDVQLSRVEQQAESAMSLLTRLGKQFGLPVNVKDLSIYMGTPSKMPELTLSIDERNVIQKLDLPVVVRNQTTAVIVEYYDQEKKQVMTYKAGNPNTPDSQVLRLYDAPATTHDEAKTYAESALGEQGESDKASGNITLVATPITDGQIINFQGIGKLPAKWQVLNQTTTVTTRGWTCNARLGEK